MTYFFKTKFSYFLIIKDANEILKIAIVLNIRIYINKNVCQ